MWPPNQPGFANNTLKIMSSQIELISNISDIDDYCDDECGTNEDCIDDFIEPTRISELTSEDKETDSYIIRLMFPLKTITYQHKAKLNLVEFICYIGSVFSLWFGISVASIVGSMVIHTYQNARTNKKLINNDNVNMFMSTSTIHRNNSV